MKPKMREFSALDLVIRRACGAGMMDGVLVTIEYVYGFERFGAYETWDGGYRVSGCEQKYESKYLEDAINGWAWKVAQAKRSKRNEHG